VFYLPQKPYNVVGDLREQLTYPEAADSTRSRLTDDDLRSLLALVDLEYLFDRRSDAGVNWEQSLSLGETQRLAMARLFYHQPMFAILDECTSAVSHVMERKLYDLCQERGITCITISHRPALMAYHDLKLELDGKGSYTVEDITHSGASSRRALTPSASQVALADAAAEEGGAGVIAHAIADASDPCLQFPALTSPVADAKRRRLPRFKRFLKLLRLLVPSFSDKAAKLLYTLVSDD
jgi:ABC-type multidrug transport system ATPase subunit